LAILKAKVVIAAATLTPAVIGFKRLKQKAMVETAIHATLNQLAVIAHQTNDPRKDASVPRALRMIDQVN